MDRSSRSGRSWSLGGSMALLLLVLLTQVVSPAEMSALDPKLSSGTVSCGGAAAGWGRGGERGSRPRREPPPGGAAPALAGFADAPRRRQGPMGAAVGKATPGVRGLRSSVPSRLFRCCRNNRTRLSVLQFFSFIFKCVGFLVSICKLWPQVLT